MEIYIEIFILQNLLINYCLLKLVQLTTKSNTSIFKLILASIVGTTPSVIAAIFIENNHILNLLKLLCSTIMILTAYTQTKKQFIYNLILLFLYTHTFGGIILSLFSNTYQTTFGYVTTSKIKLETICLTFIVFTYFFELTAKQMKTKIFTNNLIYTLTLTHKNKRIKINAYMDTGNFINLNGSPVLIIDLNIYLKLKNINLIEYISSKTQSISLETVNGTNKLKTDIIDKIEFKHGKNKMVFNNQIIAITATNCFKNSNYQALLSPLFI